MYLRKVVMLNLFASLTMSQEQLGGLGWLAALGGALAYKKLRKK